MDDNQDKKPNTKLNGNTIAVPNSGDSPLGTRKRNGSTSEDSCRRISSGTDYLDLDLLKQELVLEIRKEITKMKQEIIEVIRQELGKR